MHVRLLSLWESLRASYWFVPSLMTASAVLLSVVMIMLDTSLDAHWVDSLGWIYLNQPDGARALLSTVAGSMITVAGVTFSITMVVLSLTSQQFGPRLLRNFMRDTGNQMVLGTFVATFIYCLLILRTVHGEDDSTFVPHLAVALAVLLAILGVGVFIYFIHHTAESIQISNIVAGIDRNLQATILRLYPDRKLFPEMIGRAPQRESSEAAPPDMPSQKGARVGALNSGYFQAVNEQKLMQLAKEQQVFLHLTLLPGSFVMTGGELLRVWPEERCDEAFMHALREQFHLGPHRTQRQDVDFLFDQLTEVALRALSPGINDHFTALQCIDRIGDGLNLLASRELPSKYRHDDEGTLRVVVESIDLATLVEHTFGPIRRYGCESLLVGEHMLKTIRAILEIHHDPTLRAALLEQARLIEQDGSQKLNEEDRRILARAYDEAVTSG